MGCSSMAFDVRGKVEDKTRTSYPGALSFYSRCVSMTGIAHRVVARWLSKVATEFPNERALKQYLKEHPQADRSKHTVKKAPAKGKADELKGARSTKNEPDFDPKKAKAWKAEHHMITPNGSVISGALHMDKEHPENLKYVKEHVIPDLVAAADKARKSGKKVIFLAEGAKGGLEGTEQSTIAKALKSKAEQDTWDDASVTPFRWDEKKQKDVFSPDSPVMKDISERVGDPDVAAAGVYAMLAGQGSELDVPASVKSKLKRMGIDPDDQDAMYRASFPQDFGDDENDISRVTDEYNQARQRNMVRKIRKIESEGGIALVAPGASHAYALKPVLSK
jgi:hypothetical protein